MVFKMSQHAKLMALVLALQVEVLALGILMWFGTQSLDHIWPWALSWTLVGFPVWFVVCGCQTYVVFKRFLGKSSADSQRSPGELE